MYFFFGIFFFSKFSSNALNAPHCQGLTFSGWTGHQVSFLTLIYKVKIDKTLFDHEIKSVDQ